MGHSAVFCPDITVRLLSLYSVQLRNREGWCPHEGRGRGLFAGAGTGCLAPSVTSLKENRAEPCSVRPRLCRPHDPELIGRGRPRPMRRMPVFVPDRASGNITGSFLHKYKGQAFIPTPEGRRIKSGGHLSPLFAGVPLSTTLAVNRKLCNSCPHHVVISTWIGRNEYE